MIRYAAVYPELRDAAFNHCKSRAIFFDLARTHHDRVARFRRSDKEHGHEQAQLVLDGARATYMRDAARLVLACHHERERREAGW
jgi:hypothetical protein